MDKKKKILTILCKHLKPERVAHSERVSDLAKHLANTHGLDAESAYLAGLWHDIAKDESPDSLQNLGIYVPENFVSMFHHYPKIFHAFAGPLLAKYYDENLSNEVLSAMEWHTTGKADMQALEKVVFIADYCEPGRRERDVAFFLQIAEKNLDQAVAQIMVCSSQYLIEKRRAVHPFSLQAYNYYLEYLVENKKIKI